MAGRLAQRESRPLHPDRQGCRLGGALRRGPRQRLGCVSPGTARAEAIATDERTTEQYVHDAITQLLRIGVETDLADSGRVIGSRSPAVRVLITADALTTRNGHGHIEGVATPISIETVERIACTTGTVPIVFDDQGQAINLGREQRLFTSRQRIALAARDVGACSATANAHPVGAKPTTFSTGNVTAAAPT